MTSRLNPYLNFNGNARQAMEFYASVFGGELTITTFSQFGTEGPDADRVMHSVLETDAGYTIMGADVLEHHGLRADGWRVGQPQRRRRRRCFVATSGQLSAGGSAAMPLEKQAWGDEFGMCTDEFGVPWLVNISTGVTVPAGPRPLGGRSWRCR